MKSLEQDRICSAIEQLAIGLYFFKNYPSKKFPLESLIEILEEAHFGEEAESRGLDVKKNYSNYRKKLKEKFGIELNFQKRIPMSLNKYKSKLEKIIGIYFKKYSFNYNDILLFQYILHRENLGALEESLYLIVFLNLASLLKVKIKIKYEKIHGNSPLKDYAIIPCRLDAYANYLTLIAYDLNDKCHKYFVLTGIKKIQTDFFELINDPERGNFEFDYETFSNSNEFQIINETKTYKLNAEDSKTVVVNFKTKTFLHCLDCYPNDFWKYITTVYYFKNQNDDNFDSTFQKFLKKLISFLFSKFIISPTANAIKLDIYNFNIDIFYENTFEPKIEGFLNESKENDFKKYFGDSNKTRIAKALILRKAYLTVGQDKLIPENFQIEHIFPKKWQDTNYNGWNETDAKEFLEKLGNKVAIQKRLNIQAGNNYFGRKKLKYIEEEIIKEVKLLGEYPTDDWTKAEIENREKEFIDTVTRFFKETLLT